MILLLLMYGQITAAVSQSLYERLFDRFDLSVPAEVKMNSTDEEFSYLHFLNNTIHQQQLESASKLLISSITSKKNYSVKDLLVICNSQVKVSNSEFLKVAKKIANLSISNYLDNFKSEYSLIMMRDLFKPMKSKYTLFNMLTEIENDFSTHQNLFRELFMGEKIELGHCLEFLKNIQHPEAVSLVGQMYYHGLGTDKDLDKAMDCFWLGNLNPKHSKSFLGLGKVLESNRFNDISGAIRAYKKAFTYGENRIEALIRLYILTKDEQYLVELYENYTHPLIDLVCINYFSNYEADENDKARFLTGMVLFHPFLQKHVIDACNAYIIGNYTKSFLLFLYLSEFNHLGAKMSAFEVLNGHFSDIKLEHTLKNRLFFNLATDLKDHSSYYLYAIGECHRLGIGTEKSDEKAFSYYFTSKSDIPASYIRLMERGFSEKTHFPLSQNIDYAQKLLNESSFNKTFFYYMYVKIFLRKIFKNIITLINYKLFLVCIIIGVVMLVLLDEFSII